MSDYIKEYEFKISPKKITYGDEKPLKLSNEFSFYHNKSLFRKELNRLQYLFHKYLKTSLLAAGIRDSYLKEKYSGNYLIIAVGAGGSGGAIRNAPNPIYSRATGGAAGGTCIKLVSLTASDVYSIVIGAGGPGVSSNSVGNFIKPFG